MSNNIIVSDNIRLETISQSHAKPLLHLVDANREHLGEWLPWVGTMQTVGDFSRYITRCQQQQMEGSDYSYVIYHNDRLAGRIGIHYIQQQNSQGAIGYWLGKEFEGRGIITRSCQTLIDHCFHGLGLNRVEIRCATGNLRSAAVPERLRFTKEGVVRQAEWVNGRFHDLTIYSLLKEEWIAAQQADDGERTGRTSQ